MIRSLSLLVLAVVTISSSQTAFAIAEKDTGNLGEIRQSILSESDFQRIYGDGWVLLKGQTVSESWDIRREGLWTKEKLPDAQGVFLRCANGSQDKNIGNPEGDLPVGTYRPDQFKSHTHRDLGHTHGVQTRNAWCGHNARPQSTDNGGDRTMTHTSEMGHANIEATVGSETCPRYIVVNTFIKVNRTGENQQNQIIMNAINQIPQRILSSDLFRRVLARFQLIEQNNPPTVAQ